MITETLIADHGLTKDEYQNILEILGRVPNLNELGIFSVMWSEHCSYKSSKKYLGQFPTQAPWVVQGPGENAGIIDIGDEDCLAFKMESHNHPSFIEPYQGAATGVGGILRDVFTMGARPIANLNSLRFGDPNHDKTAFLVSGVVAGIGGYGNCMGIPTVGGEVFFDESYNANILVNAMTVGHVKRDRIFLGVAKGVGNPVIYVGSKTGRDGIHGATMASDSFDSESEAKRPTVQVGDPFLEKLLLEACLEVMQTGVVVGIQDMGAAGLTSSSFEMASRAGTGIRMDLDKVPQREEGMTPYEILLSESQERMLMVVKKGREKIVRDIFSKWDLDAVVVGEVTDTGHMEVFFHHEKVVDLPIDPLAKAAPVYDRPIKAPVALVTLTKPVSLPEPKDYHELATRILSSPNIASKHWVYEQYDHMVMTGTIVGPGSDAALIRIGNSRKAVSLTTNCNNRYVFLDPYRGAAIAVAESGRNIVCSGAKPLAVTDCLNFGNPENPEIMWQFAKTCEGLARACKEFSTPVVSGNVSFYNETEGVSIFPTPTVGMVGLLKDFDDCLSMGFRNEGDVILLLGETKEEIGGSEYVKLIMKKVCGPCPELDFEKEKTLWKVLQDLNQKKFLCSAHDLSEGGLLVSIFESAFADGFGFEIALPNTLRADLFLLSESQSRILVSVKKRDLPQVESYLQGVSFPFVVLGQVKQGHVTITSTNRVLVNHPLETFQKIYNNGFEKAVFCS